MRSVKRRFQDEPVPQIKWLVDGLCDFLRRIHSWRVCSAASYNHDFRWSVAGLPRPGSAVSFVLEATVAHNVRSYSLCLASEQL